MGLLSWWTSEVEKGYNLSPYGNHNFD